MYNLDFGIQLWRTSNIYIMNILKGKYLRIIIDASWCVPNIFMIKAR